MTYSEQLKYIGNVRLPLIIAVVFIHVQTICMPHSADWWFVKILGEEIGRIGVPLFFAISGLLFFNSFSYSQEMSQTMLMGGGKIKRRLKTILVPYLIWNFIQFLFCLLINKATLSDFFNAFWNMRSDGHWFFPINGSLWFLRELFFVSVLFPIPLCVVRYIKPWIGLSLLAVISIMLDYRGIIPGTYNAFIYFTIGAYVGYYKIVVLDLCRNYKIMWLVFYSAIAVMDLKYFQEDYGFKIELHRLGFLVGGMTVLGFTSYLPQRIRNIDFPNIAMFVFLSHSMLRMLPCAISYKYLGAQPVFAYIFNIFTTLTVCIVTYLLLRKYTNKRVLGLLTGWH